MNLKFKWLSVASIVFLSVISCNDENLKNPPNEFDAPFLNISVEEGRLVFQNLQHYYGINELLDKKDDNFLDAWEKEIGFQSFRKIYNQILEEYLVNPERTQNSLNFSKIFGPDFELTIPAFVYAKILNPEGEVKIGDKYYKYFRDELVVVLNGEKEKFQTLKGNGYKKDPSLFVSKVIRNRNVLTESESRNSDWTDDAYFACVTPYTSSDAFKFAIKFNFVTVVDNEGFREVTQEVAASGLKASGGIHLKVLNEVHLNGGIGTNWGNATVDGTVYNTVGIYHLLDHRVEPPGTAIPMVLYSGSFTGYGKLNGVTKSCNFQF